MSTRKIDSGSMPPEDDPAILERAEQALRSGDYRLAERLLASGEANFGELVQDLRIYQAELEIQNGELREAQGRAQHALDSFTTLFTAAPLAQLVVDRSGMILDANDEAARLFGLENRHLRQHYLRRLVLEADHRALAAAVARAHEGGPTIARQLRLRGRDEHEFLADLHFALLPDGGELRRFACTVVDLSATLAAREELRAREEIYAAVVSQADDGIVLIDPDTLGFIEFNEAACAGLGYDREEFSHLTVVDIQGPMEADAVVAKAAEIRATGRGEFETQHRHKNGEFREVLVKNRLVHVRGRDYFAAVWQDITDRKRADQQMQILSAAVAQSPNSVIITDPQTRITYVNEAFSRVTGYAPGDVLGQSADILGGETTPAATLKSLAEALAGGRQWKGEFHNRRRDGRIGIDFCHISPVRDAAGDITHFVAVQEDITERKRAAVELDRHRHHLEELVGERTAKLAAANEALATAKETAEAANRAKSAFLANMSHEIRTPLNAIVGLTHLVRQAISDTEQQDRLNKVLEAARHLLRVIDDILDVSKIEAGKLSLESAVFAPRQVIDNVLTLVDGKAREKRLLLDASIDPDLPPALRGDPLRIGQILLNFASNAVKFTAAGQVTLAVRVMARQDKRVRVRFEVRDTGIGIAVVEQQRIFEAFEQADGSITRNYGGSDLGLAISRRLALLMGGQLGVDSQPGAGSTFWFEASFALADPAELNRAAPTGDAQEAVLGGHRRGARILLVEDNAINQEVALALLQEAGMVVAVANDGAEAVGMLRRNNYDLILMDMQMPVMDGLAATRAIRGLPGGAQLPIVAMTANAFEDDRRQAMAAGMNDFLAKPIAPEAFYAALMRWLPDRRASPAVAETTPGAMAADGDAAVLARLGELPWVDVGAGLAALNGRAASYLRLLRRLLQDHGADGPAIRQAYLEGRAAEARRMAHSLKGATATLGVRSIHEVAARLEAAIASGSDPVAVGLLIDELTQSLATATAAIHAALGEQSSPG